MMSQQIYKPLLSPISLPRYIKVLALHHDVEGFRIILEEYAEKPTYRTFKISFGPAPYAFRMIERDDYLSVPAYVSTADKNSISSKDKIELSNMFLVENSEFNEWFNYESLNLRADQGFKHYAIFTTNECFDIISSDPPELTGLIILDTSGKSVILTA